MTAVLARPSFWSEPRDPWAWQRALRVVSVVGAVEDPRPAWEGPLRSVLARRATAGLYGFKALPRPGLWLGTGLLHGNEGSWSVHPDAQALADADRDGFQQGLATWLVERSPWVRLALRQLASGVWTLPRGPAPLHARRALRVGDDLAVGVTRVSARLDPEQAGAGRALRVDVAAHDLAPLHGPLYLLHALGWLDSDGRPTLPAHLGRQLVPESPAAILRRITATEADANGFVPLDRAAKRLRSALTGQEASADAAAWTDAVFGRAIARGAIEVHDWAPGQPRHGRGLNGDRDRKLVRWTVHDDFDLPGVPE